MKHRFIVSHEVYDPETDNLATKDVKVFKNEPEALSFIRNPNNTRRYGSLNLTRHGGDGSVSEYNEHRGEWIPVSQAQHRAEYPI